MTIQQTQAEWEAWRDGRWAVHRHNIIFGTIPTGAIIPPHCAITEPLLYLAYSAGYRQAIDLLKEDQECPATAHR